MGMLSWFLIHIINLLLLDIFHSKNILVNIPWSTALPVLCTHLTWSIYSTVIIQHIFVKSEPVSVPKTEDIYQQDRDPASDSQPGAQAAAHSSQIKGELCQHWVKNRRSMLPRFWGLVVVEGCQGRSPRRNRVQHTSW